MFHKVLVANRGEIACRILRTCAAMGVRTVAVYSDADAASLHVEMADEAVRIGPPPVAASYLQRSAILDAARATGADAVHPGYGLLSENAEFAREVAELGLTFVGPPPGALEVFGDKVRARAIAQGVGARLLPATGAIVPSGDGSNTGSEELPSLARSIGFPVLVKAAAGGGGIGMQVVHREEDLQRAVRTCSERARAAFGDARVYLERYVASPKHIELQVLADGRGTVVALGERECSVQRRHQKILEESPAAAPWLRGEDGAAERRNMGDTAIRIARAAEYAGAGTCEFVAAPDGAWFFLEVNARLQVEHPVTEMCTALDLVAWQLRVACGEPVSPDLGRLRTGHAIEARVYAEDPFKGFAPQPGELRVVRWPAAGPDLRVETGVRQGDRVTPYYDPLLAKIIAHGADRASAIRRLDDALAATVLEVWGPKGRSNTNLELVRRVLASEAFVTGTHDTHLAETLAKGLAGETLAKGLAAGPPR